MRSTGHCIEALSLAALAALSCFSATQANPQTTPEPFVTESLPSLPEVAEEAARPDLERRVDAFIRAMTRNSGSSADNSLVRWDTPICLLVLGLPADDAKTVSNRLLQISATAGVPVARAPCQPNLTIVASDDPDQVLKAWYARDHGIFGDAMPARIRQFLVSSRSRPVRVWYNVDRGRKAGMRNGHFVPSTTQADSSAFLGNAVLVFSSLFAIVDTHRTESTTPTQLADYLAMIGLTNVDLDADLGSAPTILRLFATPPERQPSGLSGWDAAFLKALYQSNPASRTQRFDIALRVTQDILR